MNLRRRILSSSLATIVLMIAIATLSALLLQEMHGRVTAVSEEFGELRALDEIRSRLEDARLAVIDLPQRLDDANDKLHAAADILRSFVDEQDEQTGGSDEHQDSEMSAAHAASRTVDRLIAHLGVLEATSGPELDAFLTGVDDVRARVLSLGAFADQLVDDAITDAQRQAVFSHALLVSLCAGGGCMVFLLAFLQYRWVVRPVEVLRDRVRLAVDRRPGNDNTERTKDPVGDIGRSFDGMLSELGESYQTLEQRIEQKSRELILSERLASVGYLAAGVAHEINNPLSIILGYIELSIRDVDRLGPAGRTTAEALAVVRSETMRCKQIVDKLLSLVRGSDAAWETVDLAAAIRDVVGMVESLQHFRPARIRVTLPADGRPLTVTGRASEIKQVLVNLVVNALEASVKVDPQVQVVAELDTTHGVARVQVIDQGVGMDADTRRQIFDPFFTRRRGADRPGTGLGLSIVYAIVREHRGTVEAFSNGPDRGSRFMVTLPMASAPSPARSPNPQPIHA